MIDRGLAVYVAIDPVDMRLGIERLGALVGERMRGQPRSRALFVFVGKRGRTMKVLTWDGTGAIVVHKKLDARRFELPRATSPGAPIISSRHRALRRAGRSCPRPSSRWPRGSAARCGSQRRRSSRRRCWAREVRNSSRRFIAHQPSAMVVLAAYRASPLPWRRTEPLPSMPRGAADELTCLLAKLPSEGRQKAKWRAP